MKANALACGLVLSIVVHMPATARTPVATGSEQASQSDMAILNQGGNAVDAAGAEAALPPWFRIAMAD